MVKMSIRFDCIVSCIGAGEWLHDPNPIYVLIISGSAKGDSTRRTTMIGLAISPSI